jgi:hypothetical protein
MMDYLQRRQKTKLFKQWVKESGLPPEEMPADMAGDQSERGTEATSDESPGGLVSERTTRISIDRGVVRLPVRYFLLGLSVIAILLVALSVVITILIAS